MSVADGISLEEKQTLLKELKLAIYTGALRVRFRERDVIYRSLEEMRQIAQTLEDEILASSGKAKKRVGLASFDSGIH